MIANEMYTIELASDETFLSSSKNLMVISTIFQQAINRFTSIYEKNEIPISFIEFYFNEIRNYDYMFRKQTKEFFENFDLVHPDFITLSNIYLKSFYSLCSSIKKHDKENYLIVDSKITTDYIEDMIKYSDKDIVSSITNIKKITEHINTTDEIIPFYKNYENFMISKLIRSTEFIEKYKGKSKVVLNIYNNNERPQVIQAASHAERLVGERIEISKQKGKITKLVIPKLKLPTAYPKTTTFNRFNSNYHAKSFISASREILILNDKKINGVSYSTNFIEKRKAINEER